MPGPPRARTDWTGLGLALPSVPSHGMGWEKKAKPAVARTSCCRPSMGKKRIEGASRYIDGCRHSTVPNIDADNYVPYSRLSFRQPAALPPPVLGHPIYRVGLTLDSGPTVAYSCRYLSCRASVCRLFISMSGQPYLRSVGSPMLMRERVENRDDLGCTSY